MGIAPREGTGNPMAALGALVIGFFMILLDTTIVAVANPAIKAALDPGTDDLDNVVWVTSAYLLAYAVPLLISGRLGDRFGPKNLYLIGLVVFTLSSLWCGFATSLGELILARGVQGFGAALMAPQTMAVVNRIFPPARRGMAMGLWGATAGVASLSGPLLGGLLVGALGWQWVFFINVPVGVIGFVAAWILVPRLEKHEHRIDVFGVLLSAVGLFLIVFGLQEGEKYRWGQIWGPVSVWGMIAAGVVVMGVFVWVQATTKREPLVPLALFRERNFSASNVAVAIAGFVTTSMVVPLMFFLQLGRGLSPLQAAGYMIPMAVVSGALSPFTGRLLDRVDPRFLLVPGLSLTAISLLWYFALMDTTSDLRWALLASAVMGVGNACMWGPLSTTANRDLDPRQAGAGAGIYNTMRTMGSVIGSAAIAAVIQGRLGAHLPGTGGAGGALSEGRLSPEAQEGFARAMGETVLVPAAVMVLAVVAVLFLRRPASLAPVRER